MHLPDYWLPLPVAIDDRAAHACDALLQATLARSEPNAWIDYTLPAPKWQFLCHVAERHGLLLHGSGNPDIAVFEPRRADDLNEFGSRQAVYAAGDGIWAMFFAIADRERYGLSVSNACVRLTDAAGQRRGPFYVFSVSRSALARQPWRDGVVYLLPAAGFVQQPPVRFGPYTVQIPQFASPDPVGPLARLAISPADFPFLAQIRGHDDARLVEYAAAMQSGAPWPDP